MLIATSTSNFFDQHKNAFLTANTDFADITEVGSDHPSQHRNQPKSPRLFRVEAADEELKIAKMSPDKDMECMKVIRQDPCKPGIRLSQFTVDTKKRSWVSKMYFMKHVMKQLREGLHEHYILTAYGRENVLMC